MSGDLALLSASELARRIQSGTATAREAVEACLARIEKLDGTLNAFIALDEAHARKCADLSDAETRRGRRHGPLHGVPLAHKDMYYREGRIATCGSKIRNEWVAPATATVLKRLDASGALDLGTLSMAEFALGPTGHNWHHGHARNAWNTDHITGGSSSGSATGIAARLFYGTLGSDTGGSIRLPAHFCGIVGLKPTTGRVSRANAMPLSWTLDCVGPLTRTVEDNALMMSIIAGYDPEDPTSADEPVPDYVAGLARGVGSLRIGVPTSFFTEADDDTLRLLAAARETLAKLGAVLVEVPIPDMERIGAYFPMVMGPESATIHREWLRTRPGDYSAQVRARLEAGLTVPATHYLDALRARGPLLADFAKTVFGRCDVLMVPSGMFPAPTVAESELTGGPDLVAKLTNFPRYTRIFNYLGLPGLTVPVGFTAKGLPVGMQFVGRPFDEATLLSAGHAYQQATEWHRRVP